MAGSDDDAAYHRSAKRMAIVLAAIVIVIFAAIFIPPLVNPVHEQFASTVSVNSPYGFSLNLSTNATTLSAGEEVGLSAWLNNTSRQVNNVTAQSSWIVSGLGPVACYPDSPIRLGLMAGYYTSDNFSLGTVLPLEYAPSSCQGAQSNFQTPYYLFEPEGSVALMITPEGIVRQPVSLNATSTGFLSNGSASGFNGVVTLFAMDEWGDFVLAHLDASGR
ncbi:MAG TPA: hypothetical protein VLY21_04930 [Nitrososphaerales archaeon]|nr:hypothetical protein [Nitrososphaerales archaeon]